MRKQITINKVCIDNHAVVFVNIGYFNVDAGP